MARKNTPKTPLLHVLRQLGTDDKRNEFILLSDVTELDTDAVTLAPQRFDKLILVDATGYVTIADGAWFRGRSVEFTADGSGVITRRYRAGGRASAVLGIAERSRPA